VAAEGPSAELRIEQTEGVSTGRSSLMPVLEQTLTGRR
jgi:hypothetical protein